MMGFAFWCYVIAVVLAAIIIFVYVIRNPDGKDENVPNKSVSNTGKPINGGKEYFKIINR